MDWNPVFWYFWEEDPEVINFKEVTPGVAI